MELDLMGLVQVEQEVEEQEVPLMQELLVQPIQVVVEEELTLQEEQEVELVVQE